MHSEGWAGVSCVDSVFDEIFVSMVLIMSTEDSVFVHQAVQLLALLTVHW